MRTPAAVAALAAALTALLLAPATPAAAHNALQSATPAPDARLTAAPTTVTLRFLQRLNPEFTTIVLSDADRRKVPTGTPAVDGTAGTVSVDQPLADGAYTVAYRVVSADGHPVQGSYRFTVADPAAPTGAAGPTDAGTPPGADASAGPVSAAGESDDGPPVALVAGGAVVALAVAGAAASLLRRRRAS
ncbi:copper resistance protein CopC [Micromonospora sp. WMMC241]|uniref:copper resistance CopC family protein n=1 Tax=Micromonospora sp. WMMC241 TaxID=3015159 RepID=UPI0022B6C840|nr:copper resistance CopC family protein [Micromonospora sp. WMMC241]MCZ7437014.1 copper resistance protein CopC [Micromonospora sp. WMMC241]